MNTARASLVGVAADNTAALAFGGSLPPGSLANTESWNGTNWTEVNDLNTARRNMGAAGIQTAALTFGGGPPAVADVESWNGTNWTNENSLSTARNGLGSAGTQTSALGFGGNTGSDTAATEEWVGDGTLSENIE